MARIVAVAGERKIPLTRGWRALSTPPDAAATPAEALAIDGWVAATVPGTLAQALMAAGLWGAGDGGLDDRDAWFSVRIRHEGPYTLELEGVATLAEVWLDDRLIARSSSMFAPIRAEVRLTGHERLHLCCRALTPRLAALRGRGRWRPQMITPGSLRHVRTCVLGRAPGWCPPIAPVGPWRRVSLIARGPLQACDLRVQTGWRSGRAQLAVSLCLDGLVGPAEIHCGDARMPLQLVGDRYEARMAFKAEPWWPHTHGDQPLHALSLESEGGSIDLGHVGFRSIAVRRGLDEAGFGLEVNGEAVFCRGANWLPPDLVGLQTDRAAIVANLELARDAGMNMLRIPGVSVYPGADLFDLCDELGILVWQDFMFANFDYPDDPAFLELCRAEAQAALGGIQGSPSLAVLCGGSEVAQQAAMLGLDPAACRSPLFDDLLPGVAARLAPGVSYVTNSPSGGPLPFQPNQGVTHYYGVGAYQRDLDDARRANVRFASECLAFSHVPDGLCGGPAPADTPAWKAAVPRDRGASWDFEDVREHYLARLCGIDPAQLRREEPDLWLDLSRCITGETMEAVFAEWRRADSSCAGGLVWTLNDLAPGAGWGVIDSRGQPKLAWWALRRAFRPLQVTITDEGLNGLHLHLINETAATVPAELRLEAYDAQGRSLISARRSVELIARQTCAVSAFELVGRFFDFSYAYRFGPLDHVMTWAGIVRRSDGALIAQAFHCPSAGELSERVALEAGLELANEQWTLNLASPVPVRRLLIEDPGFQPEDNGFALAPGQPRRIRLSRRPGVSRQTAPEGEARTPGGFTRALFRAR